MALPTEADLQAEIGRRLMMDKELFAYLATQGSNWASREATYLLNVPSDSSPAAQAASASQRSALVAALLQTPNCCAPLWDTYRRVAALAPGEDFWTRLFRYFVANSKTVKNRAFSFGALSSVTGSGNGVAYRLTVDQDNFTIESGFAEVKTAECVVDANSGAQRHQEIFSVRGAQAGRDPLERLGTGRATGLACLSPQSSQNIVPNASFENVVGTPGALTSILNWVPSAIGNFDTIQSDYYRDNPLASTNASLRFASNGNILQSFDSLPTLSKWDENIPLFARIAFKRESSCDGNLNITIGSKTATVALVAQSGWTLLTWKTDTNSWFKNWNTTAASGSLTNAAVKISLDSRTTGTLLVDDFIIGPWTPVDGAWWSIVGGTTPFLVRDYFTGTDTSSDTGIVQTVLARVYGRYLPHTSGSPTWTEPT